MSGLKYALGACLLLLALTSIASAQDAGGNSADAVPAGTGGAAYAEYIVQSGDTLFSIAQRFDTTVDVLRSVNDFAADRALLAGQLILVPAGGRPYIEIYDVKPGDTLFSIAKRFNTSIEILKNLNGIVDERHIEAGQRILAPKIDEERFETYTIKTADSLYNISRRYATTEADLVALNGLASALDIEIGQAILVPRIDETMYEVYIIEAGDSLEEIARHYNTTGAQLRTLNGIAARAELPAGRSILAPKSAEARLQRYVVQAGDTLRKIAAAHDTTVAILESLNSIGDTSLIQVGETLVVPRARQRLVRSGFGFGVHVFLDGANASVLADSVMRLGVDWVKIDVPWAEIEPEQGVFQYTALDAMVAALELANVNIMLNVYAAPDWSRASFIETLNSQMREYSGPPENLRHLSEFLANLVRRYAGLVDAYEVWKSPNLLKYWTVPLYHRAPAKTADGDYGIPDEIQLGANIYVRLLQVAYESIKSYDADALVITAGLAPVGFSDNYNSIDTVTYLKEMLLHGAGDFSDGIGAIFSASAVPPSLTCCGKPPGVESHYESFLQYFQDLLTFYQDVLAANDLGDKPIYLTQVGWGTREGANLAIPSSGYEWLNYTSEAEQALYVTQAYQLVQNQEYPAAMFLHNLNGCAVKDEEACFFSLIDAAGEQRPAFAAYAEVPKSAEAA